MGKIESLLKNKGAIYEYGNFYKSYKTRLVKIMDYYKKHNLHVAIWGAGLKGRAFLNCIDSKGEYILSVIDMNKSLYNRYITKHHIVESIDDALLKKPYVILIMNADHYADNYNHLMEKGYKGIVLDLDIIIENNVDPDEVIKGKDYKIRKKHDYDYKKIHIQILDILKEIDRICKKYDITYFLSAGSALGAIRHKGFVPWDDDADIGMLREDFEKFRQIIEKEIGDEYYYQRMKKGYNFYRSFDQLGIKNTAFVLYNCKDLRMRHGIHVDIFPFDIVSGDEISREEHVKEVQYYRERLHQKLMPHVVNTKSIFKRLIINREYYMMKFKSYKKLYKGMDRVLKKHHNTNEMYVADLLTHYKKIMYFKKTDIIPVIYTYFEGLQLPVPNNTDAYLKMMYGDYMIPPPKGKRNQRHRIYKLAYKEAYYKDKILYGENDNDKD